MVKKTPAQIGAEIQQRFEFFNSDKKKNEQSKFKGGFMDGGGVYTGESALFHDICNIGALLTDETVCLRHLEFLSGLMAEEFAKLNSQDPRIKSPNHVQRVSDDSIYKSRNRDQWLAMNPPKFGGILKRILEKFELQWGFNQMGPQQDVPTLSGFVHPDSFNDLLLRQKRHWKDPGASIAHGEYTHRLQWWIICLEHYSGGQYRLKKDPAKRFSQLPKYATAHWRNAFLARNSVTPEQAQDIPAFGSVYTNRSLWDFLCDCVPESDSMAGTTPASDSFRSPQYMNLYLTDPARELGPAKIGVLYNYLVARFNKRTWQNANNMLRPYKERLMQKWGLSEKEFDEMFADESMYGKVDVFATVDGKIVSKPRK